MENQKPNAGAEEVTTQGWKLTELVGVFLGACLVVLMSGAAIATCYQRSTLTGQYRDVYEGQVLDKFVTNYESEEGTFVTRHLLIKGNAGDQFQAVVSSAVFERAEVGMWIRRKGPSIELSADGRDWK